MSRIRVAWLVAGIVIVVAPGSGWAQSGTSGAIAGVAKDATGAVLPGVTVEASSPALIEKVRVVVTDSQGNYKIVDLRPGTYAVTFTLPGFSTFKREDLQVSTGLTVQANAEMKVGAVAETVTVTGASPVVDTQNVRTQNVLSHEVLEAIPTSRGVSGFTAMTVGAISATGLQDVGGNRNDQYGFMRIHGGREVDGRQNYDGMNMNDMIGDGGGSSRQFLVNQAAIQETTIQTGGMSAEAETGGVQVNVVPKDGGNTFKVYLNATGTSGALQTTNVSDFLRTRNITQAPEVKKIYDVGGGVGGPIKRDALWFYTAHRWWGSQEYIPNAFYNATPHTVFYTPSTDRGFSDYYQRDNSIRLTWQVSSKDKVTVSNSFQKNCQCNYYLEQGTVTPESAVNYPYYPMDLAQATWSHPATNRLLFEAGVSWLYNKTDPGPQADVLPTDISITESTTGRAYNSYATGLGAAAYGTDEDLGQINSRFSVSYVTGSHAFKTGLTMLHGVQNYPFLYVNQSVAYTFTNQKPVSLTQWASPGSLLDTIDLNLGLYAQDQWTLKKLTLNLGVRYDQVRGSYPDQTRPAGLYVGALTFSGRSDLPNFKDVTTRLGAAYDVFGNGKTAIKASLGRYLSPVGPGTAAAINPANAITTNTGRTWNDAVGVATPVTGVLGNGNFKPDCDLTNPAANGECGPFLNQKFGTVNIINTYAGDVLTGWGNRQYNWQGSLSVQHELRPGVGIQVSYFRTSFGNFTVTQNTAVAPSDFTAFCVTAPANSALPGNGGNQVCGNYDLNRVSPVANLITLGSNFGEQSEVYNGFEVTSTARFGKGGLLQGGMGTGRTVTDNCYANARPDLTPSAYAAGTPRTDAFCHVTPPWSAGTQVKASVVYPLPYDLRVSGVYQNIPGVQQSAQVVYSSADVLSSLGRSLTTGQAVIAVLPAGVQYEDRLNQFDLRFTKIVKFGHARLQGSFDIYNLFNDSTILLEQARYGSLAAASPSWRQPSQFLAPRLFKFGVQMDF